jgi:hypothetical protein
MRNEPAFSLFAKIACDAELLESPWQSTLLAGAAEVRAILATRPNIDRTIALMAVDDGTAGVCCSGQDHASAVNRPVRNPFTISEPAACPSVAPDSPLALFPSHRCMFRSSAC